MCTRSKTEDEDAGTRIAKAGDGASPVLLILICTAAGLANAGAVVAQTRTKLARDDIATDPVRLREWKQAQ
jgi:hypothetical protein